MESKKYLTAAEAAEMLNVAVSWVYSKTSSKQLVYFKPAGKIMILKSDLEAFIEKSRVASNDELDEEFLKSRRYHGKKS